MKQIIPLPIKPVHSLLAAIVLLAMAVILFFCSNRISTENAGHDTSDGAGSFHSPLMCI